jgi:hypothetical protein
MLNWFFEWIDPKILKLELWVNKKVVERDNIDVDLDRVKKGTERETSMFRQPPDTGMYGPVVANLQGGKVIDYVAGPGEMEAFSLILHRCHKTGESVLWWRHREAGATEDFRHPAFSDMKEFFVYATGEPDKYWECVLRTKAMEGG